MNSVTSTDDLAKRAVWAIVIFVLACLISVLYDMVDDYKSPEQIEKLQSELFKLSTYIDEHQCIAPYVKKITFKHNNGNVVNALVNTENMVQTTGKYLDDLHYFEFDKEITYVCKAGGQNIKSRYYRDQWGIYNASDYNLSKHLEMQKTISFGNL